MFKSLTLLTFFLLVASSALFPSEGGRGILNPKALSFVLFSFSFAAWFLTTRKIKKSEIFPLAGLFFLFFGLTTWNYISFSRGIIDAGAAIDETKLFLITFLPFFGAIVLKGREILSFQSFFKSSNFFKRPLFLCKNIFSISSLLRSHFSINFLRSHRNEGHEP